MYSVLLVDDERIIREGVYEILSMADMDLDLTMAASAVEAIAVLEERKIDILIMDIRMPQMSGLELYDLIREKWPHSKMIFLSGYLEFDYVYKVHKHARYVLKAEEDSKIVEAVKETIAEIEGDLLLERASLEKIRHLQKNKYYERMLLFKEFVDGSISAESVSQELLDKLGINLNLQNPVYSVAIRYPAVRTMSYDMQYQAGEQLSLLIEKFFMEIFRGAFFVYNKSLTYVLLQPTFHLPKPDKTLEGISETFQKAVEKNIGINASVYVNIDESAFPQAVNDFIFIRDVMLGMAEDEVRIGSLKDTGMEKVFRIPESTRRELNRKVQLLENQFENPDRDGILSTVAEIRTSVKGIKSMHNLFVLNLYTTIAVAVLAYAKKIGLSDEAAKEIGLERLYNITSNFKSWDNAFDELSKMLEQVFCQMDICRESKNHDVVQEIKSYIDKNLDGDTSLYALSSHVHLCPEHLLRTFKKQEGITVLQYINDLKLSKARDLLVSTDIQIKDISVMLGFTSAGYFGRFFKGKTGVTPNVYREQYSRINEN